MKTTKYKVSDFACISILENAVYVYYRNNANAPWPKEPSCMLRIDELHRIIDINNAHHTITVHKLMEPSDDNQSPE